MGNTNLHSLNTNGTVSSHRCHIDWGSVIFASSVAQMASAQAGAYYLITEVTEVCRKLWGKKSDVTSIDRRAIEKESEQGLERGRNAGQVQLLQRLLGATESTLPELVTQSLEVLRAEVERLEQELGLRQQGPPESEVGSLGFCGGGNHNRLE